MTSQHGQSMTEFAVGLSVMALLLLGSITLAIEFAIALFLAALVYRSPWVKGWRILFMLPMLFMPSARKSGLCALGTRAV